MGGRFVEGRSVEGRYVEGRLVGRTFCSEGRFVEGRFVVVPKIYIDQRGPVGNKQNTRPDSLRLTEDHLFKQILGSRTDRNLSLFSSVKNRRNARDAPKAASLMKKKLTCTVY
jgi:hypothetical protein